MAVYNKVSEQRLDEKQAAGEVRNSQQASWQRQTQCAYTDENVDTVESLLLSQEDKPQSHRTAREISSEVWDLSIISFADYSQRTASQVLQEKARSTAAEEHSMHALFAVCSLRDDNVITSKPT